MLRHALLDLTWLLVGVHMQRELLARRVGAELLEPDARASADGVGGEADTHAGGPNRLELHEVVGGRALPEAFEPSAPVGREQEHELDPGFGGSLDGRVCLGQPEVVKLADSRVSGGHHLPVDRDVVRSHALRGQTLARSSIDSRQPQKSVPSTVPRSAR